MAKNTNRKEQYNPEEYWESRLNKDFSLGGVGHLGFSLEYNIWLYKARLCVLRKILKKRNIDPRGKRLLDIGVGTGFYINFWEGLGIKDVTGIDITAKSVKELKKKYPTHKFIKADICDKKIPINDKFDIIIAFDVLFHIVREDKFGQAIKNIKKLCHIDTTILIMDNFLKEYKPARGHENDRTLKYYKKILGSNSMEIKDIKPIFYFMNTPIDIERINNKLIKTLLKWMWWINGKIIGGSKRIGRLGKGISYFWAFLLYCLDRIILRYTSIGPGTKLLLAKPSVR